MSSLNLRAVIDLRSASERKTAGGYWPDTGVDIHAVGLSANPGRLAAMEHMRANPTAAGARAYLRMAYEAYPSACAPAVWTMYDLVASRTTPLLVHCAAGKDRTGFLIAMLLMGVGVSIEDVLADYLRSGGGLGAANSEFSRRTVNHRLKIQLDEDAIRELLGVREEFLLGSIKAILDEHGSILRYFEAIGIAAEKIQHVREHLIA